MNNNNNNVEGLILVSIVSLVAAVIGGAIVGFLTWNNLPAVGGEWWFYIRITCTLIAFIISAKIFAVIGQLLLVLLIALIGIQN